MQRWLDKLRWRLQQEPDGVRNPKEASLAHGFFPLKARFSLDQMGIQVDASAVKKTWATSRECSDNHVGIHDGKSGWDKRSATWQVCFSADLAEPQPQTSLIFRGQGRVSEQEKMAYHPDVHVLWNSKAWLTRETNMEWSNKIWGPFVKNNFPEEQGVLLTCDNVDAQTTRSWQQLMTSYQTTVHIGEANHTHVWQGVDRHCGRTLKHILRQEQLNWLAVDENSEAFPKLPAWKRRVLMTHWVGDAVARYKREYVESHSKFFTLAGLCVRLDRKGDGNITVESNPAFQVQPYTEWPGMVEQIEAAWKDDEVVEEPESDSDSDSSSSDSSEAVLGDVTELEDGHPSDEEMLDAQQPQPAGAQSSDGTDGFLCKEELIALLKNVQSRGKLAMGIKHLAHLALDRQPLIHPRRLSGQMICLSVLRDVVQDMGAEWPEL